MLSCEAPATNPWPHSETLRSEVDSQNLFDATSQEGSHARPSWTFQSMSTDETTHDLQRCEQVCRPTKVWRVNVMGQPRLLSPMFSLPFSISAAGLPWR